MLEYLGNKDLLNQPKTAFLASSTIPTDMVLRCYDWAHLMSKGDRCVVSGFSSHLEEQVLHFLISGTCPIILVLARRMYKRVPEVLCPLLDNGRLLMISTSASSRQSRATAQTRNRYICEISDEVILVGADAGSSLHQLHKDYRDKVIPLPFSVTS